MPERQNQLFQFFRSMGLLVSKASLAVPTHAVAQRSPFADTIFDVYKRLGGIQQQFPLLLRGWDMEVNSIAVELDEDLHFNRYRATTLQTPVYKELPRFPLHTYQAQCQQHEHECLRAGSYGGKWTNSSCEQQFGPPAPKGILTGNGSPRWKQRAFYDFVKDLSPLLCNVRVVRISIWDSVVVNGRHMRVADAIYRTDADTKNAIHELFTSRS